MQRFLLLLFIYCICGSLFSQNIQDTIITYDTIKNTKTVIEYDYSHPLLYNVIGINGLANSIFISPKHSTSFTYKSFEMYCNISRNYNLLSCAIRYVGFNEKVAFSNKIEKIEENTYMVTDTLTWYRQVVGNDTTIYYITKEREVLDIDTIYIDTLYRYSQKVNLVSLPLRYGYFFTKGYWRINVGGAIAPKALFTVKSSDVSYLLNRDIQYNIAIEPTIEATYWMSDKIFFHSKFAYSHNLFPYKSVSNTDIRASKLYIGLGFSYLFYDKMWE